MKKMVETCVAPSELHLKKELNSLQKARFLRDPQTCSSYRSTLSSKSFLPSNNLNSRNSFPGENVTSKVLGVSSSDDLRKKVYLYNWRQHSGKSIRLDEGEDSHASMDDNSLDTYTNVEKTIGRNSQPKVRRKVKKSRTSVSKRKSTNHSAITKLLDLPQTFVQSSDTDYSNSDDLVQLTHVLTNKAANQSPSVSPLFSGSGCGSWSYSSKILRNYKKDGSSNSCTPASTNSYYKHGGKNKSMVESWDGTATSVDGDEVNQIDLARNQRCGIPWPKNNRGKSRADSYSPSFSDTLRRKGSSLLCGSQPIYNKKRSSQGMPLLRKRCDEGSSSSDIASDEILTNCEELELEASSRLDGRRWSSCKSQDGLQSLLSTEADCDTSDHKTLSQKHSPKSFDDIIGQDIVVHSLKNAVKRGRIAPAYLFQGARGTGKTSTARIFAAALNCLSNEDNKPCRVCRECTSIFNGNGSNVKEVDAINHKGINKASYLLKNISLAKAVSLYKILIIDECHMLSSRMWEAFTNFLQEPPPHLVLIFVTIDPDSLPRVIMSHCQKFLFSKVKDIDIVCRLRKLSYEDNLEIESDALNMIALNSDGSLRDAETMLEQLSLLGKRITTSLVNELIGVVSDDKLLDLLEIAMSSDTAETVKRSRELMDSGVDPIALMTQLAALITDIISGTNQMATSQCSGSEQCETSLSNGELKKLQQALKILSDADKQLQHSSERSTWFIAALLQLGSTHDSEVTRTSSSSKQSIEINNSRHERAKDSSFSISKTTSGCSSHHSCSSSYRVPNSNKLSSDNLAIIWRRCIQKCHSETLREFLNSCGKLASIAEIESGLIATIVFQDDNGKFKAEKYLSIIINSLQQVLESKVEVKISILSDNNKRKGINAFAHAHAVAIDEHKLENAWLQITDKNSPELRSQSNTNRSQLLSQNGVNYENHIMSSKIDANHLIVGEKYGNGKKQIGGPIDLSTISPSLLHRNNSTENFDKESMEHESEPICSAFFCWKQRKKAYNVKGKKGFHAQSPKAQRVCCLGNIRGRWLQKTK